MEVKDRTVGLVGKARMVKMLLKHNKFKKGTKNFWLFELNMIGRKKMHLREPCKLSKHSALLTVKCYKLIEPLEKKVSREGTVEEGEQEVCLAIQEKFNWMDYKRQFMKEKENMGMKAVLDSQEKGVKTGANMKANT